MKKNGFTLLELLIGISLISVVMVFLFRLLYDIQNENLSNTYIVANQTNRDEMINVVTRIMYENGPICDMNVDILAESRGITINYCNNKTMQISVTRSQIYIVHDSKKYRYVMKDPDAFYDTNVGITTISLGSKNYIKIRIKTSKKGLKNMVIDDVEFMGETNNLNLSNNATDDFTYTGNYQVFYARADGVYKIEAWGAEGGKARCQGSLCGNPGKGGYAAGKIYLHKDDVLYVYVGQKGYNAVVSNNVDPTFNGGGGASYDQGDNEAAGAGGGASDVRLVSGEWNNSESLASRILVAGGGGGNSFEHASGAGGGINGQNGNGSNAPGATQTSGHQFGIGTTGTGRGASDGVAGGGGGYWGGVSYDAENGESASGGSGYVSGHVGCVAIKSATDTSPKDGCANGTTDINCSIHYSGTQFTSTSLIRGDHTMPTHDGLNSMVGNSGNGYVKITYESQTF